MKFPKYIFFTGAPGSGWSVTAKTLETLPIFNTSDRSATRHYTSASGANHNGMYYGQSMEFKALLDADYLDSAWGTTDNTRLIKSHEWAAQLNAIEEKFTDSWIMIVYRPDASCSDSWFESGGFSITYPNYQSYIDADSMKTSICNINQQLLKYTQSKDVALERFTTDWVKRNFGRETIIPNLPEDLRVALITPAYF